MECAVLIDHSFLDEGRIDIDHPRYFPFTLKMCPFTGGVIR
jgi:hypothetical protein